MADPLLDQEGMEDILAYLERQHSLHLKDAVQPQPGEEPHIAEGRRIDRQLECTSFISFAREHLKKHRPVEITHHDANFGVKLDNGDMFLVAPGIPNEGRGTMQPANAVPVTGLRDQYSRRGVEDRSMPTSPIDKTQSQGPRKLN